jgi:hypothetical protein
MKRPVVLALCLLIAGAAVFVLAKGIPFVCNAIEMDRHARKAALREPAAEQEWRREFGDPAKTLSAFPRREDSESATRLIELAHPLGIEMARPKDGQTPPRESNTARALTQAIRDYGSAELGRPGGSVSPPPEAVRIFLQARDRDIDAIVNSLSSAETPVWKSDVSLGAEAPIPNLLGQMRLQRLLVAQALSRARVGQEDEAERVLRASWSLNASLRDRPDVMSQLIAIAIARMQVGLARRISVDPASWLARFAEHDYRPSVLRALEAQALGGLRQLPIRSSRQDRASRVDFLDLWRTFLVNLRDSPVEDGPIENLDRTYLKDHDRKSEAAIVATIVMPNLANAVRRADRLIIDTELTEQILHARLLKARLRNWPTGLSKFSASRMTGARWIYSVGTDGRLTVSFSREPSWEGQGGLILPLCYESM